jgi:hypothetical protein
MHGSVINRMVESSKGQPVPVVGMGVTECCYTDRHAYTVITLLGPKSIMVQRDKAVRLNPGVMGDCQEYRYEPDPDGISFEVTFRVTKNYPNGKWVRKGFSIQDNGFIVGYRNEHFDYSF